MALTVRYRSRRTEVWAAYRRAWRAQLWKYHLVLSAMMACLLLLQSGVPDSPSRWVGLVLMALALPLLLAFYPQLRFKPQERVLTLTPDAVVTTIGKRNGTIPWAEIRSVRDEKAVTIERANGNALLVPARAFGSIEERRAFVDFATSAAAR